MDGLRRWALWVAVLAVLLAMLTCIGAGFFLSPPPLHVRLDGVTGDPSLWPEGIDADDMASLREDAFGADASDPPGFGIAYLALPNALLLITVSLMALPLLIGNRATALVNGIASLIGGIVGLIGGIVMAIIAFVALIAMISLFLAAPFGTLAYLAIFGFFDIWTAGAVLGLVMFLQLASIVFLAVAQQKILGNKRLVIFLLLAVLLTFVTMILHAIVPIILVSITDALAGLITAIVGLIWALLMAIGGLVALIKQLNLGRQGSSPLRSREPTRQPPAATTRTAHAAETP